MREMSVAEGFGAHADKVQDHLREAVAQRESAMQRRLEEFLGELRKASRRTEESIAARGREDAATYHKLVVTQKEGDESARGAIRDQHERQVEVMETALKDERESYAQSLREMQASALLRITLTLTLTLALTQALCSSAKRRGRARAFAAAIEADSLPLRRRRRRRRCRRAGRARA